MELERKPGRIAVSGLPLAATAESLCRSSSRAGFVDALSRPGWGSNHVERIDRSESSRSRARVDLERQLDRFQDYCNTMRPHRAIGRRSPAEAFAGRPKATLSLPGLRVPAHVRVRRDRIDITGVITLRHNSRLHHIGLGRRLVGTRVIALVDCLRVRVITEDGELIRELNLDPSRDYQPHGRS
jgi:hypothetical protein